MKNNYRYDIVHLYFGTKGSAGLYLHEIYSTLLSINIKQKVIVSSYFPFKYGFKIFFPISDFFKNINNLIRIPIRGIELILGYFISFFVLINLKPKFLNFSLISLTKVDFYFLFFVKKILKIKLVITCHDVVPFGESETKVNARMAIMMKIFELSDFFIVHNSHSRSILVDDYLISESKVFVHRFPLMDLQIIFPHLKLEKNSFDFIFLGFLRINKGLNLLLEAWKIFIANNPNSTLYIGGKIPADSNLDLKLFNQPGITFNPEFLEDRDLYQKMYSSSCIVLPYLSGTNSGILSLAIASGCNIIYSDIDCFSSLDFLDTQGMFKANSVESLVEKLESFLYKNKSSTNNIFYRNQFRIEVTDSYEKLIY